MSDPHTPSPALSFIIPAFNAHETLRDTLDSVLAQTRSDWEAIVVDDGSTDDTPTIARSFNHPQVRLVTQRNQGLAAARNTGLRHARGRFASFLDADDLVLPTFAERSLAAIADADAVACWYEFVGPRRESLAWRHRTAAPDLSWPRLIRANPLAVTVVLRRDALPRLLGRVDPFDGSLPVLEDWDLWLRLARAGLHWAPVVDEPLVQIRLRPGSLSQGVERMHQTGLSVISRHARGARERDDAIRHWNLLHLARFLACGDLLHAEALARALNILDDADVSLLASMCLSAKQRAHLCGPADAERLRPAWIRALLRDAPLDLAPRLRDAFTSLPSDWVRAGAQFAVGVPPGDLPVIFGVGRNGQDALAGACDVCDRVFWIDDRPDAAVPLALAPRCTRLTREQLTPRHLVLVTPSHATNLSRDLRAHGIRVHELRAQPAAA